MGSLTAILLTHFHPDHVQGLFHLRWGTGGRIPVHAPPDAQGCADLYQHPGILAFEPLTPFQDLNFPGLRVTPVPLIHSKPTLGFCVESANARFAYLTDTVGLPPPTQARLKEFVPAALALDCAYPPANEAPRNHNDLTSALRIAAEIGAPRTRLTHVSHELDLWLMTQKTQWPGNVGIARDGERLNL